jgi:prepilin-type N-terminal cleavage/methylation domain-containing protein
MKTKEKSGFTLIELLVVIAIIAILAAMLLPVLSRAKMRAQGAQCQSNMRQLAMGWIMYLSDSQGRLPINGDEGDEPASTTDPTTVDPQWCPGRMDSGQGTEPTNNAWIKAGLIYPGVNNTGVYRCPADTSTYIYSTTTAYPKGPAGDARVRSMSMNGYMNGSLDYFGTLTGAGYTSSGFKIFRKDSDLAIPGASSLWLMIDENPYSINDAFFVNNPSSAQNPPTGTQWTDCPASYHAGACGINFCDGHAIIKKWMDATVTTWNYPQGSGSHQASQVPPTDLNWLLGVTTIHSQ